MGQHVVVATLLPVSSLRGHTGRQVCTFSQVSGLASPPSPMPRGRTAHHPLDRGKPGVCWTGLCGEQAARQGESLAGIGREGEGVSVGLLSCWLQTCSCLPTASPPQKCSSTRHGNSPASPICCEHVLNLFSSASSCLSCFPRRECQQLGTQGEPSRFAGKHPGPTLL